MMRLLKFLIIFILLPGSAFAGASREFDGNNDSVNYGDIPELSDATNCSAMGWVNVDNVDGDRIIYTDLLSTGFLRGTLLFQDNVGSSSGRTDMFKWQVIDSQDDFFSLESESGSANAGTWQHVSGSFEPDTASGARLWIDGAEDANSPVDTTNVDNCGQTDVDSCIGLRCDADSFDMDGKIAYVLAFSKTITEVESIESMWKPGLISGPELELFAPLWGDSTEIDLSENDHTGTVTGATAAADGPPVMFGGGLPL